MKLYSLSLFLLLAVYAGAQQQTYDLFSFKPPRGWKKKSMENLLDYSTSSLTKGTWGRVTLIKSTASQGSIDADFKMEWNELVLKPYKTYGVTEEPVVLDKQVYQGWNHYIGLSQFVFNKDSVAVMLSTFSDGERCASLMVMSNSKTYGKLVDAFLASISLSPPTKNLAKKTNPSDVLPADKPNNPSAPVSTGFQYNTTNFDDGWTSVVKEDWVEATKGDIKVLLHYPRKEDEIYYTQHQERMSVFWNMLVAPRYSNLRNYEAPDNHLPESAYFANGLLRDNASGRDMWVTLFSKGKSGWIEIITPDKASFVNAFGIENPHAWYTEWDPLVRLSGMNRFAVGENDLPGKWSNEFTGSTAYYSVYTGLYTGSSTFASRVNFVFQSNKRYNWDLAMASGGTGTLMKVDQAKASGNWKILNHWQIWFSEIERKARTYNAYFSCVKGGRILWLQDTEYGSYTAYGKISE